MLLKIERKNLICKSVIARFHKIKTSMNSDIVDKERLNKIRSENFAIEGARQAMFGRYNLAVVILNTVDPKYFERFFQSFIQLQAPPMIMNNRNFPNPVKFRWACHCIASLYNIPNQVDIFLLVQPRFIKFNTLRVRKLREYLQSPTIMQNTQTKILCAKTYIEFINEEKQLSLWLLPHLQVIFQSINLQELFSIFHFKMFYLFDDCNQLNESELQKLDYEYINDDPYKELFMIPQIYTNPKVVNIIERKVFDKYRYPIPTNFAGSNMYVSLINTSFTTNIHFIDLVRQHINHFYAQGDYPNFWKFTGTFGSLQPWLFVSVFRDQYPILPFYFECPKFKFENISSEFITRLYNDRQLFQVVRQLTGTNKSYLEFVDHSLPYLLFYSFGVNLSIYYEPIEKFKNTQLYIISDKDKVIDYDFCYSYFTLTRILDNFTSYKYEEEFPFIQNCESFINSIKSRETKNALNCDLLSLIFIKNKQGEFACPFDVAVSIIKVLLETNDNPQFQRYIKSCYKRFNLVYCLNLSPDLSSVISPNKYQLLNALIDNDLDIARYLADLSPENEEIYERFNAIRNYNSSQPFNLENKSELTIKEIALALNDENALKYALSKYEDEKSLYEKRLNNDDKFISFDLYRIILHEINNLKSRQWPIYPIAEDLPLFKSFYEKLTSFIPISLSPHLGNCVKDILLFNPEEMIDNLLQSGKLEKAQELAITLNVDINSMILSGRYAQDIIELYTTKYLQVAYASFLSQKGPFKLRIDIPNESISKLVYKTDNEIENSLLELKRKNLFSHHNKTIQNLQLNFNSFQEEIEFYDKANQQGIDNSRMVKIAQQLLQSEIIDTELLINLGFRIPEKQFKATILQSIQPSNLSILKDILSSCLLSTNEIDFIINSTFEPFPIDQAFHNLIKSNQFHIAKEFYDFFGSVYDFDSILIEEVKLARENQKSSEIIFHYFPSIKEKVLELFPDMQSCQFDPLYKDIWISIPSDWESNLTPNEIVANHINEYGKVNQLMEKFHFLNIDSTILELIDDHIYNSNYLTNSDKIYQLAQSLNFFLPNIREKDHFIDQVFDRLSSIVSSIETSVDDEFIVELKLFQLAIIQLNNNEYISQKCSHSIQQLDCLCQFSSYQFYTKFQETIQFNEFQSIESGKRFADICLKYDQFDLLQKICQTWEINEFIYEDSRYLSMLKLGLYNDLDICDYGELTDQSKISERTKLSNEAIEILSKPLFYDSVLVQLFSTNFPPIEIMLNLLQKSPKSPSKRTKTMVGSLNRFSRKSTIQAESPASPISNPSRASVSFSIPEDTKYLYERIQDMISTRKSISKEQKSHLTLFLNQKCPPSKTITFNVINCELTNAISVIDSLSDKAEKARLFSDSLFSPAICFGDIERLRSAMKITPEYAKPYLNELLELTQKLKTLNLKLQVCQFLSIHDIAAETAIELFNEQCEKSQSLPLLDIAQIHILQEFSKRKTTPNKDEQISTEKLNDYLKQIDLQRKYCMFLFEKKLALSNFSAFRPNISKEPMTLLLFKEKCFDLALEFIMEYRISTNLIGERIADILASENDQSVINYVSNMETHLPESVFREIFYAMINRMIYLLTKYNLAMMIIQQAIKDPYFKCALMIQYNLLEDAIEIAFKNGYNDFVSMIANKAFLSLKRELVQKCCKYLDNLSSS